MPCRIVRTVLDGIEDGRHRHGSGGEAEQSGGEGSLDAPLLGEEAGEKQPQGEGKRATGCKQNRHELQLGRSFPGAQEKIGIGAGAHRQPPQRRPC
jgi:hypothetical protein